MKQRFFIMAAAALTLAACSNDENMEMTDGPVDGRTQCAHDTRHRHELERHGRYRRVCHKLHQRYGRPLQKRQVSNHEQWRDG